MTTSKPSQSATLKNIKGWRFFWLALLVSVILLLTVPYAGYVALALSTVAAWIRKESTAIRILLTVITVAHFLFLAIGLTINIQDPGTPPLHTQ